MIKLGFLKIGHVVRAYNSSCFNVYGTSPLSPEQNFFLMSLIDSFPAEWCAFAKSFAGSSLIEEIPNDPKIGLGNGNSVPILDISSKQIYEIFLGNKQIPPTAQRKLTDKYPDINVEWDKIYFYLSVQLWIRRLGSFSIKSWIVLSIQTKNFIDLA